MDDGTDVQRPVRRGAQGGKVGPAGIEGGLQPHGGQGVGQFSAPLRLELGQPEKHPFLLCGRQQGGQGIPVQRLQPGVQLPVGEHGQEAQPPVVIGEHHPGGPLRGEVLLGTQAVGEEIRLGFAPVGGGEVPGAGVQRIKFAGPGVFQVEGVDQQQDGLGGGRLGQHLRDQPAGDLPYPVVHRPAGPIGIQIGLIEPGPIECRTPGEE